MPHTPPTGPIAIVLNPNSAGGATKKRFERVRDTILSLGVDVEVHYTAHPGHGTALTRAALEAGAQTVAAVGGDGTINEVLNGFFDGTTRIAPQARLALLTSGTGADLRRSLGWPSDLAKDAAQLTSPQSLRMDVGRLVLDGTRVRHFANVSSVGVSGRVAHLMNASGKMWGPKLSFFGASARGFIADTGTHMKLTIGDAVPRTVHRSLVAVCNGAYFGSGMNIAPDAHLDDGVFDVVEVDAVSTLTWLRHAAKVYRGRIGDIDEVTLHKAQAVRMEAVDGATMQLDIDGEPEAAKSLAYTVVPGGIEVVAPAL